MGALAGLHSRRAIAKATGIDRGVWDRIEAEVQNARPDELRALAARAGVPESYLMHGRINRDAAVALGGALAPTGRALDPLEQIRDLLEANSQTLDRILAAVDRPGMARYVEGLEREGRPRADSGGETGKADEKPAPPSRAAQRRPGKR